MTVVTWTTLDDLLQQTDQYISKTCSVVAWNRSMFSTARDFIVFMKTILFPQTFANALKTMQP